MQTGLLISFIAFAGFAGCFSQPAPLKPLPLPDRGPTIRRVQPGGVPRPVINCDDDLINVQRFYKESCSNDSECYGSPESMVCKDKVCQCVEGNQPGERFVGEKGTQLVCVPAPALYQKCKDACQKPTKCLLYTGEGADGKTKICQCEKPYILQDNGCVLECGPNQVYDFRQAKCLEACKNSEVNINGVCKPLAELGAKCEVDRQCTPSFSKCIGGACKCSQGFVQTNSLCTPQTVSCPTGEALKSSSGFQSCTVSPEPEPVSESDDSGSGVGLPPPIGQQKRRDDCPTGHYCVLLSAQSFANTGSGFCCPQPALKCPVGQPHPNASCGAIFGRGAQFCPAETHFCHRGSQPQELCCPTNCPMGTVYKNGRCYPHVGIDGNCQLKEQCYREFSDCVNGKCQCVDGSKRIGDRITGYCDLQCADDEVRVKNKCQKRLKLGASCKKSQEQLCPEYAYCNKDNLCACRCGAFTLADNTCAPAPICQPVAFPIVFAAGAALDKNGPPPIPRISEAEREKLLKNVTMCAIYNKTPPQNLKLGQCSAGQFCSRYINNVGLCCPKPDSFCFGPDKPVPNKSCDFKKPLSCGLNAQCSINYRPLDKPEDVLEGNVCCPKPNEEL